MKKKTLDLLKFFVGWPLSIIAFYFIWKLISPFGKEFLISLKKSNPYLLLTGILCFVIYFFIRSYVWQKILKEKGYNLKFKETSFHWGMSELKRYVPGNVWSFIGRADSFSKKQVSRKDILHALIVEAQLTLISATILSLFSLPFFVSYLKIPLFKPGLITWLVLVLSTVYIYNSAVFKLFDFKIIRNLKYLFPEFSPIQNFNLLVIYIIAFLFFALGNYFSIISVFFLNPQNILLLSGLFVFSLLAGYISLITPTGLGVREGILTLFLSKFLTASAAGFASIYSRIILILSEILYLLISFFWIKTKNKFLLKTENFVVRNRYYTVLVLLIFLYITYFIIISFLKYDNFYVGRFDLGNMDQTVWNTINGRIFEMTDPNGTRIVSRLAFHADFILILLSPFYLIWSDPRMLLIIQTLIVAAGALFVFLISKKILKDKRISLVFSGSYLLYPGLQFANIYDFHGVTLSTTFLLAAFYYMISNKRFLFLIFAILSALTKEDVWLITALFGLYMILKNLPDIKKNYFIDVFRKSLFGLFIFIFSVFSFYYLVWNAIPNALGSGHFALSYYADFGNSPGNVIKNILFYPQITLSIIMEENRLSYLKQLYQPAGFLSLLFPFPLIFSLPNLLINLLSNNPNLYQIYYQYTSTITPFIFVSSIYAVRMINGKFHRISLNFFIIYILAMSFYSAYSFGPLIGARSPNLDPFVKPQQDKELIHAFLKKIPEGYTVSSTNNLGAHLSHRQKLYTVPYGLNEADFIIFLLNGSFAKPSPSAQKQMVNKLKKNKEYELIVEKGDFAAFKRQNIKFVY